MKPNVPKMSLLCKILIFSGLIFSAQLMASEVASPVGIARHLKDATKINRARAPLYAGLSNGKSLPLSYELILMENLALMLTHQLDQKSLPYLAAGIGLFEDDLVDMKLTPDFKKTFGENGPPSERVSVPVKSLRKEWLSLIKDNRHDEVYKQAVGMLDHGTLTNTNQNCLTRHFVESIARSIMNQQWHRDRALNHGLKDPSPILNSFLKMQINTLSWAYSLDRRAFSIQQKNVPLFCQDVPAIPYK